MMLQNIKNAGSSGVLCSSALLHSPLQHLVTESLLKKKSIKSIKKSH